MKTRLPLLALTLLLSAPALAQDATWSAPLRGLDGADKGTASVTTSGATTLLKIDAKGLPEGWHGIHFHAVGKCDAAGKFASAGAHATSDADQKHGIHNDAHDAHAGDLPNLWIGADGTGKAEFYTPYMTAATLGDTDGTSLMIHATVDDHKTDPSGNSGDRIACGVFAK